MFLSGVKLAPLSSLESLGSLATSFSDTLSLNNSAEQDGLDAAGIGRPRWIDQEDEEEDENEDRCADGESSGTGGADFYGPNPALPPYRPKQWTQVRLMIDRRVNKTKIENILEMRHKRLRKPDAEIFIESLSPEMQEFKKGLKLKSRIVPSVKKFFTRKKNGINEPQKKLREACKLLVQNSALGACAPLYPSLVGGTSLTRCPRAVWQNTAFTKECLDWHNLLRARHGVKLLQLDPVLCEMADKWAVFLANINEFYHQNHQEYGENLFLWPKQNLPQSSSSARQSEIDGKYVAVHWYREHCRYPYNNQPHILHSYTSEFTQMVWASTTSFGCSKAKSINGKTVIVAFYHPKGNIPDQFHLNVVKPRELREKVVRITPPKVRLKL